MSEFPYKITFHEEADGGPAHLAHLLIGFSVRLRKNGETLFDALVEGSDDESVTVRKWCASCAEYCGPTEKVNIFDGSFDEVMYL